MKFNRRAVIIATVGVLIAGTSWTSWRVHSEAHRIHMTAYFSNSNGIYRGDDVRVLGVPVGTIDQIVPMADKVKINFSVNDDVKIPANVNAVVISPSLVSVRAIQLTPAYTGGPVMANNAVIPQERTAVPIEWDDLRTQLQKLTDTLQPTTPGGTSTLGAFVNTAADNLRDQGVNIHDTITKLSQAFSTLGDHSRDIFSAIKNLSILVSALQSSKDLMKQLNENLASVTAALAANPGDLGQAVADLNDVVGPVKEFVAENKDAIGTTSAKLASISTSINESLADLKETLHIAPNTFQNFVNIYQPAQATFTGILAAANFADPISFLCGAIQAASRLNFEQSSKLCVQYLAPIVKNRQYNFPPLGENLFVGATARPNERTYSEDWLRPDYIPPHAPPTSDQSAARTTAVPTPGPLAAEAPEPAPPGPAVDQSPQGAQAAASAAAPGTQAAVRDANPADGLAGMMAPAGGGS